MPVRRLVLNDVGPVIEWQALQRIGQYLGQPVRFASVQQAADMLWSLSTTFGPHTPEQWLELSSAPWCARCPGGLGLHYDPAIAVPFRAIDAQAAAAGEAALWQLYDHVEAQTLLLRGAQSDLLSPATAQAMRQRGPQARLVEFAGWAMPYAGCARPGRCRGVVSSGPVRQETCMKTIRRDRWRTAPQRTAPQVPELIAATAQTLPEQVDALVRARNFAEPLIAGEHLDTGENALDHADAVAAILKTIGGSEAMQAASYLVHACIHLSKPQEVIAKAFGDNFATLAVETTQLMRVQQQARAAQTSGKWWTTRWFRRKTCARCCWLSRVTCAWSCCAWRRVCRHCATTRRASSRYRPALPARLCTCLRRWPTAWVSGRSGGKWRTGLSLPGTRDLP